jgi:parallel beta-helix repeat protein
MRNIVSTNHIGFFLYKCNNNLLTGNTVDQNSEYGILLRYSENNSMSNNTLYSNNVAISLEDSSNKNTISNNYLSNNIMNIMANESENRIYDNDIDRGRSLQILLISSLLTGIILTIAFVFLRKKQHF